MYSMQNNYNPIPINPTPLFIAPSFEGEQDSFILIQDMTGTELQKVHVKVILKRGENGNQIDTNRVIIQSKNVGNAVEAVCLYGHTLPVNRQITDVRWEIISAQYNQVIGDYTYDRISLNNVSNLGLAVLEKVHVIVSYMFPEVCLYKGTVSLLAGDESLDGTLNSARKARFLMGSINYEVRGETATLTYTIMQDGSEFENPTALTRFRWTQMGPIPRTELTETQKQKYVQEIRFSYPLYNGERDSFNIPCFPGVIQVIELIQTTPAGYKSGNRNDEQMYLKAPVRLNACGEMSSFKSEFLGKLKNVCINMFPNVRRWG